MSHLFSSLRLAPGTSTCLLGVGVRKLDDDPERLGFVLNALDVELFSLLNICFKN